MRNPSLVLRGVVTWGLVVVAFGLVALATLVPGSPSASGGGTPFWCLTCGDFALADAVANVALFVPLGWALGRARVRPIVGLAALVATTITVEWLQYTVVPGRDASLSDILTNSVGGAIGMALPGLHRKIAQSSGRVLRAATLYGVLLVAGLVAGEGAQGVPLPRRLRWTEGSTQGYVPFTGSLKTLQVDGAPVLIREWLNIPPRDSVAITLDLLSARPDTGLAQLIVGWMPGGDGWLWFEQRERDLRVHVASLSDRLRLRGHSTWLGAAMPAIEGEPVTIRVVVRRFDYAISAETRAGRVVRHEDVDPGHGWRLFTPFEHRGEPWASLFTGAWMAVLLAPLAYLASVRSRATAPVAALGAGVSLLLLPIVSGCAWLPLPGWCGAMSGFLVGVARSSSSISAARPR
jgi:hypothetical protein